MSGKNKLLLDDMGLGKTAQSIVAWNSLGAKRVLVICPPITKWGWEKEVKFWSKGNVNVQVMSKMHTWIDEDADVVICPYSLLQSPMVYDQLRETRWPVMVVDEVHYCKTIKAARTKSILGAKTGIVNNAVYRWGLTGTLMTNTPIDLFPVLRSLGARYMDQYTDWMKYTRRYCKRFRSKWGWDVSGAANLKELSGRLFNTPLALRRTKSEVLDDLPPMTYRLLPVEAGKVKDYVKWDETLRHADFSKSSLGLDAETVAEVRQDIANSKLAPVSEYVCGLTGKVVVFAWHRSMVEQLTDTLNEQGKKAVMLYGGMTPKNRKASLDAFTTSDADVIVANITTAGTGLDGLQEVSSHCVFAEVPWTFSEIDQCASRLHRIKQKDSVLSDILLLKDSAEEYVMKQVFKKEGYFKEMFLTSANTCLH